MEEYTIKQAAEVLEVSTSTIRRRIKSGELIAAKRKTSYGQQYFIPKKELDHAITDKNVIDIQEVSRPISQEELKEALIEAVEGNNKDLFEGIADKIDQQNELIKNHNEELKELKGKNDELNKQTEQVNEKIIDKLDKQQEIIEQQSEIIEQLQEEKKKSLLNKIKDFFM